MLVVGSPNSSNSNRLRELAERMGAEAYLLDGAEDINPDWLLGKSRIGVTAGASAPEVLVQEVLDGLCELGASAPVEVAGRPETITFSLPRELRIAVFGDGEPALPTVPRRRPPLPHPPRIPPAFQWQMLQAAADRSRAGRAV